MSPYKANCFFCPTAIEGSKYQAIKGVVIHAMASHGGALWYTLQETDAAGQVLKEEYSATQLEKVVTRPGQERHQS